MEPQVLQRMSAMIKLLEGRAEPIVNIGPGLMPLEENLPARWKVTVDMTRRWFDQRERVPLGTSWVVATAESLPFRDESIPTLVTMSTFQVMRDQEQFLAELARVLAPRGFWCVTVEYGLVYNAARQRFLTERVDEMTAHIQSLGLSVSETRWMGCGGVWVAGREEAFSFWIMGTKP